MGGIDLATARTRSQKYAAPVEAWLNRRSVFVIGLVAALVGVLKAGLDGFETERFSPDAWPQPLPNYPFFSYGIRGIVFFGGLVSPIHYAILGVCLIVITLVLAAFIISRVRHGSAGRLAALVLLGGPIVWVMVGRVGHPDAFAILGGIILGALGKNIIWAGVGAVIASLGSPEQATVIALSLFIVSLTESFKAWRRGAATAVILSSLGWLGLSVWSRTLGYASRLEILPELLGLSFERFFLHFPVLLYTGFGVALPIVIVAALNSTRWQAMLVAMGAIGIPLLMTAVTMDQSRILVTAGSASTTAIVINYSDVVIRTLQRMLRYPFTIIAGFVIFLPAIDITGNVMRKPWGFYFPYLQVYLIDRLPFF